MTDSLEPPPPASVDADPVDTPNPALAFDPVDVRARFDGWTPDRQREFVEALADCGVAREAAARVGMSEQSVARLRRRGDAGSFAAACEVAVRIATRRLRSIAFERAVEGTIKRHYYHGELKAEERVYDNRLLRYLLEKTGLLCDPGNHVATAEKRWPALLDSIELGGSPDGAAATAREDVWEEDGRLWTGFPPPHGSAEPRTGCSATPSIAAA